MQMHIFGNPSTGGFGDSGIADWTTNKATGSVGVLNRGGRMTQGATAAQMPDADDQFCNGVKWNVRRLRESK
jgi:hypothetical protein